MKNVNAALEWNFVNKCLQVHRDCVQITGRKMFSNDQFLNMIRPKIIKIHLELTALIQDIQQCSGSLELLNELNAEGREKISLLRRSIEELTNYANEEINSKKRSELLTEVEGYKSQLTNAIAAFRTANVVSSCVISKLAREQLFSMTDEEENKSIRKRKDKQFLTDKSGQVTNKLLSISRHLAETVDRSANTLDTLVTSSDKVSSTKKELENQQQVILQSGKLLGKYSRREITDKALLAIAFIFFLACVFYILQKRMF